MTRARDVANVLSTATNLATDTETAAAISSHNSATSSVHGISDTAALATQTYVQNNKGINKGNTASRPASPANGDLYYNTETSTLEVYDVGWWVPNTAAEIPTSPVATNQPSSRAYNNGQASVAFTPATSGGKATTFTVISTPGSYTNTGSSSPIVVTGLQSSTSYTYAVTATGPLGTSAASSASAGVTATTVPQIPSVTAVGGNALATITITPGATGGSAITGFTVTSSPGGLTATGSSSPLVVTGLTNGTAYTFTAVATNANGTSVASSASSSVTPSAGFTVDYLVVAGAGSGGSAWEGGGGGAGGLRSTITATGGGGSLEEKLLLVNSITYTITVGAGAAQPSAAEGTMGNSGTNSSISGSGITTITSLGGGGGATAGLNGLSGGSGGGCSRNLNTPGSGTQYQGYSGGGNNSSDPNYASGGGGGAGGPGTYGISSHTPGNGGPGVYVSITGSSVAYAGGGAGSSSSYGGTGGLGGGGNGTLDSTAGAGTVNTGGGGGGVRNRYNAGGAGGSGVVIIRALQAAVSTTGSPNTAGTGGGTYIYKFNDSGSITF